MRRIFQVKVILPLVAVFAASAYLGGQSDETMKAVRAANKLVAASGSRRAVVVGGTSGIGEGIAKRLAEAQYSVTIVGRSASRGAEVVSAMSLLGGKGHSFIAADAFLLSTARSVAAEYARAHPAEPLDILVLTQGMATLQGRTETAEGVDQKLALHYFGRVAFILNFLPLLRLAPSPRVLSVLSAGVHGAYAHVADDPELREHYSLKAAADAAGLYNDLELDTLSRLPENAGVTFAHAAPGFVNTAWGTEMPWAVRMLLRALKPFGKSAADCAEYMCVPLLQGDEALDRLAAETAAAVAALPGSGPAAAAAPAGGAGASARKARFLLLDQYGGATKPTPLHTAATRDSLHATTLAVMRRADALPA